jgi:hypothetical protein
MNFENRLFRLSLAMNELPTKPDFDSMSETELEEFNKKLVEDFHKQNAIKNYDDAVVRLNWEYSQELLTQDELEILLEGEKEFWVNKSDSVNLSS